jgi:hypothetical protein
VGGCGRVGVEEKLPECRNKDRTCECAYARSWCVFIMFLTPIFGMLRLLVRSDCTWAEQQLGNDRPACTVKPTLRMFCPAWCCLGSGSMLKPLMWCMACVVCVLLQGVLGGKWRQGRRSSSSWREAPQEQQGAHRHCGWLPGAWCAPHTVWVCAAWCAFGCVLCCAVLCYVVRVVVYVV